MAIKPWQLNECVDDAEVHLFQIERAKTKMMESTSDLVNVVIFYILLQLLLVLSVTPSPTIVSLVVDLTIIVRFSASYIVLGI